LTKRKGANVTPDDIVQVGTMVTGLVGAVALLVRSIKGRREIRAARKRVRRLERTPFNGSVRPPPARMPEWTPEQLEAFRSAETPDERPSKK
jgi:hypothetical protein